MWRFDTGEVFGFVAGIVLGLGFFALVAYLLYLFVFRRIQMNHEMRLEMIRQGRELPPKPDSYGSLKAGIVLCAVGLAILLSLVLESDARAESLGGETVIAFVPLMIGLGLIAFHIAVKKDSQRDQKQVRNYSSESVDSFDA